MRRISQISLERIDYVHKMFSKICSAAQALWKILLEICQKCRYFMVFLSKCCGEELKEKEMVKVPGWFLSNDGTAPIFILIVHKFKLKVSVCIARWRWGCGSSPAYNNNLMSHFNGLDDGTVAHLGYIQPKQVWLTASGWKLHYMLARFQIWSCSGNIF